MSGSGQKFIARNRAPRVQIEYDVELYGAQKKVQLPFVVGVMADLAGKSADPLPAVGDRKFLEIDVDNFDDRMKSVRPRAAFAVPNVLTGEGNLPVDLTFESMEDFSPAAVARKVGPLAKMLEARTRLSHLVTYMDGKSGAEELIARLITDPQTFGAMAGAEEASAKREDLDRALAALGDLARAQNVARAEAAAEMDVEAEAPIAEVIADGDEPGGDALLDEGLAAAEDAAGEEDFSDLDTLVSAAPLKIVEEDAADEDLELSDDVTGEEPSEDDALSDLDDLPGDDLSDEDGELSDLDDLLADATAEDTDAAEEAHELDTLQGDDAAEDDLADDGLEFASDEVDAGDDFDLDDLLDGDEEDSADLDALLAEDPPEGSTDDEDDFEALLGEDQSDEGDADLAELDALPEDDAGDDDLDALDAGDAEPEPPEPDPFGILTLERPADLAETRKKFRIAILGDFSGRASRGIYETGDELAKRKPIKLDIDRLDDVISRLATTLVLPIGEDGAGIEVRLNSLDDLHPDELYENVEVFAELAGLRQQVARGDGSAAIARLQEWAGDEGRLALSSRKRAKGTAVPADRRLSDFQALIGDLQGKLAQPSPADELIRRIVGPYVQAAPDPRQESMLAAIDQSLSAVMRAILHHPDFQAVESTWRSLELLARRVDAGAEIVLYDVSAEEWAADLAAQEDLAESGLFRMLAEEPRLDEGQGALSAVFGLYMLEETPPHAELLARMSKISAWMDAPFVTAISPRFLETPLKDRSHVIGKAWDALKALPQARHVGLASPRFLLRLPYGRKTEPVDAFEFEEFNLREGLKGMLWANPVVLSAILLAETSQKMGKKMRLGEVMSLDDMPFHYMTDEHGDQVALPCTERMLDTRRMAEVVARGFIPLLSIKGRNVVRQGSFQSLAGVDLAGPWADAPAASAGSSSDIDLVANMAAGGSGSGDLPDGDDGAGASGDDDFDFDLGGDSDDSSDLDDLLAGFGDSDDDAGDSGSDDDFEMDPDLESLLADL